MSCMDKSIDFQIEMSSNQEDIQMAGDDEVDMYGDLSIVLLANDQLDVLDYFEEFGLAHRVDGVGDIHVITERLRLAIA